MRNILLSRNTDNKLKKALQPYETKAMSKVSPDITINKDTTNISTDIKERLIRIESAQKKHEELFSLIMSQLESLSNNVVNLLTLNESAKKKKKT